MERRPAGQARIKWRAAVIEIEESMRISHSLCSFILDSIYNMNYTIGKPNRKEELMFDYHIHSTVSFDAHSSMEDIVETAREKGVREVCFTEHFDLNPPVGDTRQDCDFSLYRASIEKARGRFAGFPVKLGLELGIVLADLPAYEAAAKAMPFDFILCSQHVVNGKDPYYGGFFDDKTVRQAQREYLQELYDSIKSFDNFDVAGHIGYMDKYVERNGLDPNAPENRPFAYDDFPALLDDILRLLIKKNKGIEVNTSTYDAFSRPLPHPGIIRRYAELGGKIVTTGSDAHRASEVGRSFSEAYQLLLDCGFSHVCTYTNRQPVFHKLEHCLRG
ncbi:MAG TPA: histidinol phosphate phosphatase [Clostridiales bacterium]|nr:histidinol phosphate phosphatase [Clostridiales bacterium]